MKRLETKLGHMSKQLDISLNLLERLRTMKVIPIEVRGDITEAILKMRELEKGVDAATGK